MCVYVKERERQCACTVDRITCRVKRAKHFNLLGIVCPVDLVAVVTDDGPPRYIDEESSSRGHDPSSFSSHLRAGGGVTGGGD